MSTPPPPSPPKPEEGPLEARRRARRRRLRRFPLKTPREAKIRDLASFYIERYCEFISGFDNERSRF